MRNHGDRARKHHVELKKPDKGLHATGVCPFKNWPNELAVLEAKLREEVQEFLAFCI